MPYHRLKRSFTSGEVSPLLFARADNNRYKNGSKIQENVYSKPQGPAIRRAGFEFKYDLTALGADVAEDNPRQVEFVFNETYAYVLVFFTHTTSGNTNFVIAYNDGLIEDPASPGNPLQYEITGTFDFAVMSYAQSFDVLFVAQPNRKPISISRLAHDNWSVSEITFTDIPVDWAVSDWPSTVAFFEQRIVYAGNASRPQTMWFSKSGDFYDFGVNSPIEDDDALTFTLDSGEHNKILWLQTSQKLLVGTLGDEWTIGGSQGQPLTYSTVFAARQTTRGSEHLNPIMVGHIVIFLERLGRTVNMFKYDYTFDSYSVTDLSILSPHLTESNFITEWAYQQTPNGIIWAIRDDGTLLGLTFQQEHNVVGWHRHVTDGKFLSVACIPGDRETEVWVVVERVINSSTKWYLEKMQPEFISHSTNEAYFLDSHLIYSGAATDTLTGLGHLEGEVVDIFADGSVHAPKTVSSAEVTLDREVTKAVVGMPYTSRVEPTIGDIEGNNGTTIGRNQRITNLDVYLHNSLGLWIGKRDDESNEEKLEVIPFRRPSDLTGQAVPLFTGIKHIAFPEGYDRIPTIIIEQQQPLPMTILGLIDTIEVYE